MQRHNIQRALLLATAGACLAFGAAHAQTLDSTNVSAVPTYESVGLYWNSPGAGSDGCTVQYRVQGSSTWSPGLNLWFDSASNQCRGSLVYLTPGTPYEVQMGLPGAGFVKDLTFSTWSNSYPVAQVVNVPASTSSTLDITQGGSPSGYIVYDGGGATLDAQNNAPYNINVTASYVIVRNFHLTGAQQDGVYIDKNQHDVVIEDNEITNWGRTRDGTWGSDMDSGIRAVCVNEELTRVTIQRNYIHDPRWPTNSWAVAHPEGPQGVTFSFCGGNNVFRWNVVDGGVNHFNDGIGGEDNFSTAGFPNKDSDLYGNKVMHVWDDGLEIEGGDQNVRVWGNYVDYTGTGISSTVDSVGPLYIFRNVWNRNQFLQGVSCDNDQRQPMFKDGSSSSFGNGRRYLFHNTMLQARDPSCQYGLGGGAGVAGTGDTQLVHNTVSMNNIYDIWKPRNGAFYQVDTDNTFSNDMIDTATAPENGIVAAPQYAANNGWVSVDGGLYQLAAGTPGYDQGVRIPNFNDHFNGAAPDVGAAEAGDPAMQFGIAAATLTNDAGGTSSTTTTPSTSGASGGSSGGSTGTITPTTTTPAGSASVSATMDSSSYTINAGQTVTFTTTVMGNSGTPSGAIEFQDNGNAISGCASVALSGGAAACTTSSLAGGSHAITGTYSGDATYAAAVAGPITQTVNGTASASATASTSAVSTLIAHYYQAILQRAPDSSGLTYWTNAAATTQNLGMNVSETFYAMAEAFFSSTEYAGLNRDSTGFVTDLYNAFLSRAPDATGLSYWTGQISAGMPREVVLASFMFSNEFFTYMQGLFGTTSIRPEITTVGDFYRGVLGRLPDTSGFTYWLQQFRTAQCQGASAVSAAADQISGLFADGSEYASRNRTNAQYVGDLYNAFLRRGGDATGVQYWINQLDTGAQSRDAVRRAFEASAEFAARVNAVASQTCM